MTDYPEALVERAAKAIFARWSRRPGSQGKIWETITERGREYYRADARAAFDAYDFRTVLEERDDLQRTFDLIWAADQRAIKHWQEAGEGRELTWPDRSKLTEWLLDRCDTAIVQSNVLQQNLKETVELLEEVRDKGLIYWEPNTSRGHVSKAEMLKRVDTFLARIKGETT